MKFFWCKYFDLPVQCAAGKTIDVSEQSGTITCGPSCVPPVSCVTLSFVPESYLVSADFFSCVPLTPPPFYGVLLCVVEFPKNTDKTILIITVPKVK